MIEDSFQQEMHGTGWLAADKPEKTMRRQDKWLNSDILFQSPFGKTIMKYDVENIREETEEKVKQAYLTLRSEEYSKARIQDLEKQLSKNIYETEVQIQDARNSRPEFAEEYYRRRTILKRIADGLAWVIVEFNSSIIRACSINHSPGFMAGKKGYKAERNIVEACTESPKIKWAIQCDITNVLRLGDVLTVKTDGEIQPIEVKGSKSGQATRQRKQAAKIVEFMNTGIYKSYIKGLEPLRSYQVPIVFEHYWNELEILSLEALDHGMAWNMFDDAIIIGVTNKLHSNEGNIFDGIKGLKTNWANQKLIFRSIDRHINRDPQILPLTRLPLTLFPVDTALGVKFILGELNAIVLLNIDVALQKMMDAGVNISKGEDGNDVINLQSGSKFSIVDGWEKILLELITIPSFIEYIQTLTKKLALDF